MRRLRTSMVVLLVAVLAACGGDDDGGAEDGGDGAAIALAETSLGSVVVDAEGMTLYLFVPDGQAESTCYDDCEANWPPLTGAASAGEGLDESLLGSVERTDGTTQVTYNGWPLYYFATDAAAGDVNGQGVNGVWFVVDAAGNAIG